MDNKTVLAIGLILLVLLLPTFFAKPPAELPPPSPIRAEEMPEAPAVEQPSITEVAPAVPMPDEAIGEVVTAQGQEVVVASRLYAYRFSSRGARLIGAELLEHQTFHKGESGTAQIIPEDSEFLEYQLMVGGEMVSLADWDFEPSRSSLSVAEPGTDLEWVATRGPATVRITYTFDPDRYLFHVSGSIEGVQLDDANIVIGLGPRLRSVDSDSTTDFRSYGFVTKADRSENTKFSSLDPGESRFLQGPFGWVAVKSKYFLAAVLAVDEGQPDFSSVSITGGDRTQTTGMFGRASLANTRAHATAALPLVAGHFAYSVYVGPQEYRRLEAVGYGLEDVNPYGWIFRPLVRPLSVFVVKLLLWGRETFAVSYGVLLIMFGLAIRIALWPLNQKAMRSSIAMQAIQPDMKRIQEVYKDDRVRMQQEMMKLYKKHGMGPLGPLGGCLPILLQMPVLLTLFFVFLNTIEFRGVPFLWLPDLSRADPLYIVPLVMGASMYAMTKIGQIGVPPNPQTKMMTYMMPIMMTVLFLNFSSGLNLYYATSNIASIPQQWLIAKERLKRKKHD
ncbi:MAG: membrane protein insertase YidC [Gemmatimonadota bacterium]|nr:membrane protein insertase YidC [Gemmatimonadota bacterium]MDH5805254.1 membrane protein insertase YidC [Gemmatimonadota bacterium]